MKYYQISIRIVRVASNFIYIKLIFTDKNDAFCGSNLGDLEVNNNQDNDDNLWKLFESYLGSSISTRLRPSFRMSLALALNFSFYFLCNKVSLQTYHISLFRV